MLVKESLLYSVGAIHRFPGSNTVIHARSRYVGLHLPHTQVAAGDVLRQFVVSHLLLRHCVEILQGMFQDENTYRYGSGNFFKHRVEIEDVAVCQFPLVLEAALRNRTCPPCKYGGTHHCGNAKGNYDEDHGGDSKGSAIALCKLCDSIAKAIRMRLHRLRCKMALDVFRKGEDSAVPALRLLAQSLHQDHVEIAAQGRRNFRQRSLAWQQRRGLADDLCRADSRHTLNRVRQPPREQPVEQGSQGKNVACHAQRKAFRLLRAGIARRQQPESRRRLICACLTLCQYTRDAKIEQPRFACRGNQNIRGLQVQM